MGAIREYQFTSGPETATLPTAPAPTASTHLVPWGYLVECSTSESSATSVTAAAGITVSTTHPFMQTIFVQGSGGAVDITASPQISAGTNAGKEFLCLVGTSDTNTLKLDTDNGLALNGSITLHAHDMILLMWGGSNWIEVCRNE